VSVPRGSVAVGVSRSVCPSVTARPPGGRGIYWSKLLQLAQNERQKVGHRWLRALKRRSYSLAVSQHRRGLAERPSQTSQHGGAYRVLFVRRAAESTGWAQPKEAHTESRERTLLSMQRASFLNVE
jgi:hypothetical protein